MNLYDPNRPKLPNSRPTWLRNHIAIPHFEIFPLENGNLELSIWLPIKDETFTSVRFTKTLDPIALHGFIQNFINDPEETCEFLFKSNDLEPELRHHIRLEPNPDNPNETRITQVREKSKKPRELAILDF